MQQRERRYPPSPYPPHSADTRAYRDHWDLGWKHLSTLDSRYILNLESGLRGASRHGYRDGLLARWSYLQRAKRIEPEVLQQERQMRDAERAAAAAEERPY